MSLDDDIELGAFVSQREALLRDRELDWADRKAAWDEQRLYESIEAEESLWEGTMRQMPDWIRDQHWSGT